ncbi:TetR family transcriptional regulator [Streptomyces sp. B21-108]|uniref:TetR/AcrR family transcriptional regulator n=1 Tax=Streptomyces sp. B21-108 TaxID=3039419 RepID=UPI002FF0A625
MSAGRCVRSGQLLVGACRCFCRTGVRRTTNSDIVEESQLSRPTVRKYAGTKDEAFAKAVQALLERASPAAEDAAATAGTPEDKVPDVLTVKLEGAADRTMPATASTSTATATRMRRRRPSCTTAWGANGRQMTLILGAPLARCGFEPVALDNLGCGLTQVRPDTSRHPQAHVAGSRRSAGSGRWTPRGR